MNETYTTIDTFSVDALQQPSHADSSEAKMAGANYQQATRTSVVPVIARVPDLNSENQSLNESSSQRDTATQIYSRIDSATKHHPQAHTHSKAASLSTKREVNAHEAIRSADLFLGIENTRKDIPEPKQVRSDRTAHPEAKSNSNSMSKDIDYHAPRSESWSDLWLLQAEAAVVPYTKWIVLAVVLAALALALVLVQGSKPATINPTDSLLFADTANPESSQETVETGLLEPLNGSNTIPAPSVSYTAKQTSFDNKDQTMTEGVIVNRPVGLPYRQASTAAIEQESVNENSPQAELVGQIVPIEPYRTTNTRVANQAYEAPSGYPSTQSNGLSTNPNGIGSQIR